ncbi:MAG TPA: histidine kinase [Allosphingosinicella sp.]
MADRIRRVRKDGVLRVAIIVWGFGHILEDIGIAMMGRMSPLTAVLVTFPLFLLGVCLTVFLDRIRRRLFGLRSWALWLSVGLLVAAAAAIQTAIDLFYLHALSLTLFPEWQEWASPWDISRMATAYILYLWTFCLMVALAWAVRLNDLSRLHAARAAAFEATAYKAEAAMLRLQLNPHFLFNALNSVAGLVAADRKAEADQMICRLANFLRSSLNADPTAMIRLDEEVDYAEAYLHIEQARFDDRLILDVDMPSELADAAVPNFILQPLVENAVKHGTGRGGPIDIKIACEQQGDMLAITVANQRQGKGERGRRKLGANGIGLQNTRQRLSIAYGRGGELRTENLPDGFRATVLMPFARVEENEEPVALIA